MEKLFFICCDRWKIHQHYSFFVFEKKTSELKLSYMLAHLL